MSDDARQRAREAASRMFALGGVKARRKAHLDAIEAYVTEYMRGEAKCQRQWEAGDSPCRVHGERDESMRDYDTGYAHGIRDTEAERDSLRQALDSIGDMLIPVEGAVTNVVARTIARCIEDAKWRKQPEFSERPASLRKRVAELEAVVRAADAMRDVASCQSVYSKGWPQNGCECSGCAKMNGYDAARAKVQVPGE